MTCRSLDLSEQGSIFELEGGTGWTSAYWRTPVLLAVPARTLLSASARVKRLISLPVN
jgi:hypothetical protein